MSAGWISVEFKYHANAKMQQVFQLKQLPPQWAKPISPNASPSWNPRGMTQVTAVYL